MRTLLASLALITLAAAPAPRDDPAPKAVVAWPSGPLEVRIAFDRPIAPERLEGLTRGVIPFAESGTRAGREASPPLGTLKVAAARLEDGGRTLVLATDPHPFAATYSPTLPGLPAVPSYTLGGVQVEFTPLEGEGGKGLIRSWWPAVDPASAKALAAAGSVEHGRTLAAMEQPGRASLRTMIALPGGKSTAIVASNRPIEQPSFGGEFAEARKDEEGARVEIPIETTGEPLELAFDVLTDGPLQLSVRFREDNVDRPNGADRPLLPWAPGAPPRSGDVPPLPASMTGGDPARGEVVFFGEAAKCSTCHAIGGRGGKVGPDLSEIARSRDAAMIYREILEPSAAIHPDYVPYVVNTKEGQVIAGVARSEGPDDLAILGTDARTTLVKRSEIEEIRPSATSIMPVGLPGAIGDAGMRDLMAYLLNHR